MRFIKYVSAFSVFFNVTFIYFSISAEDKTVTFDLILKMATFSSTSRLLKGRYEVNFMFIQNPNICLIVLYKSWHACCLLDGSSQLLLKTYGPLT